jgi:hypothetical protein
VQVLSAANVTFVVSINSAWGEAGVAAVQSAVAAMVKFPPALVLVNPLGPSGGYRRRLRADAGAAQAMDVAVQLQGGRRAPGRCAQQPPGLLPR